MSSEADQAYGGLTSEVHIAGYSLERAMRRLEWLLDEDRWKTVGSGFDDVNTFIDTVKLDEFKIVAEQRKKIASQIKKLQPKVTNKTIAKALGVNPSTIDRDLTAKAARGKKNTKGNSADLSSSAAKAAGGLSGGAAASTVAKTEAKEKRQAAKEETRKQDAARILSLATVTGKFPTLIVDPPWDYEGLSLAGRAAPTYATMTHEQLLALDLADPGDVTASCARVAREKTPVATR